MRADALKQRLKGPAKQDTAERGKRDTPRKAYGANCWQAWGKQQNRNVKLKGYGQICWQAWEKTQNRNVSAFAKKKYIFLSVNVLTL